jgi:multidrug efflux system outer membrane protein
MKMNLVLLTGLGALLGGCTMMPKYERPAPALRTDWPGAAASSGTNAAVVADLAWQDFITDPHLRDLVGRALTNNSDLRVAMLRVEQTRAQYRIQRSELFPGVQGDAGFLRQKTSGTISGFNQGTIRNTYSVNATAAYEVDLFGRVRSLNKEGLEKFFATEEARKAAQISLVAEVASQYLTLAQLNAAKKIAQQTLEAVGASFELNQRSFEAGAVSELDLRTAEAQVQTAQVDLATLSQQAIEARNALELVVGQPLPDDLGANPLPEDLPLLADLPPGMSSDILLNRPDILAAEHTLKAANADIGALKAAFFPRILLTGSGGVASAKLTDLFTGPSATWNFSPQITVPIFNMGAARAELDVSKISKRIEIANYEKAVRTAFREIADAFAARRTIDTQIEAQERLFQAQQKRFDLTNARYRVGVDNYVEVLRAQQDLYAARQTLLRFQAAQLLNSVTVYRSLGGGWKS